MNPRERWIMAIIIGLAALYIFGWKALYLYGVAALIYLFSRGKR